MNTDSKTAVHFRKQLEAQLRGHSNKTGESIDRLRRKVAFDRLLARIFSQEPSFFFLKGGYAMELRTARARATKDMDLVGGDFLIDDVEKVSGANWLEFCDIPAPVIPMISVEQQFAEKLHSYTFPREQINTRAKDLIDLILLLQIENRVIESFKNALRRVFRTRNTHPLPPVLPELPMIWQKPFSIMAGECGMSQSLEEGFIKISNFYRTLQA